MSTATNDATPIVVSDIIKSVNPQLEYTNYYDWSRQFEITLCTWYPVHYIYPFDATGAKEEEQRNPEPDCPSDKQPSEAVLVKYEKSVQKWESAKRLREIVDTRRLK